MVLVSILLIAFELSPWVLWLCFAGAKEEFCTFFKGKESSGSWFFFCFFFFLGTPTVSAKFPSLHS